MKKAEQETNCLNNDLLLKRKIKDAHRLWKGTQIPINDGKNLARACKDAVRKSKAELELKMARKVQNNKKQFFRHMSSKQKHRENIGCLLNSTWKLVTNKADGAEDLSVFFASVFTSAAGPQVKGSSSYNMCQLTSNGGRSGLGPLVRAQPTEIYGTRWNPPQRVKRSG